VFLELLLSIVVPLGLDLYLPAPADNPLTPEKVELGRALFNDRRLSVDESLSCASCHRPDRSFSSADPVAVGVFTRQGTRNAPALINLAYGRSFFRDGRETTLERQVLRPIEDPNEMGFSADAAAARVGLTSQNVSEALASYVRTILSGNSPYDRYVDGGRDVLGADAQAGLRLFRGKARCSRCHLGPTFSDEKFHNTGVAMRDGVMADVGRFGVTGKEADLGAFRTPTLREVARTAPYMHDGSLATLEAVVDFYDQGGRPNPGLDSKIRSLGLTRDEKTALIAFLRSLTGEMQEGWPR
jgi:cytochrome c peroxidase